VELKETLLNPTRLYSAEEIRSRKCPIPMSAGVYAWFFTAIPPGVPTENCEKWESATLLYIGISPKAPPKNGRPPSRQTIRSRVRYHYRGNAEGSTLRLTLGCLLQDYDGWVVKVNV
jgi:hypothetical protein